MFSTTLYHPSDSPQPGLISEDRNSIAIAVAPTMRRDLAGEGSVTEKQGCDQ